MINGISPLVNDSVPSEVLNTIEGLHNFTLDHAQIKVGN